MSSKKRKKIDAKLIISLSLLALLILFAASAYLYNSYKKTEFSNKTQDEKAQIEALLVREHAYIAGNKDAKVTVVEFFDPACSACVRISPVVARIPEKYLDQVRVVYRSLGYHKGSDMILSLLEAAKEQGKFKEAFAAFNLRFPRWFINNQVNDFVAWGVLEQSGTDVKAAKEFLDSNQDKVNEILRQNMEDAENLGITSTPTFFVNGMQVEQKELIDTIESEIAKIYKEKE
ncbi:MAG: thioredoxin domain-containing protein [Campylobacteraceae bacterium]|jgi:protein-disulfide isomerase|nr:thioredoxin domain-containing protein [Campylobacteraceae bacterium]